MPRTIASAAPGRRRRNAKRKRAGEGVIQNGCISAPAKPSAIPTRAPSAHRTERMSQTITRMPLVAPDGCIKVFISECKGALRGRGEIEQQRSNDSDKITASITRRWRKAGDSGSRPTAYFPTDHSFFFRPPLARRIEPIAHLRIA